MITKDSIESAYSFFHQKWQVYRYSNDVRQREDIEYAIGSYADSMSHELYQEIAQGKTNYLVDYRAFADDLRTAIERLEKMLPR